MLGSLFFVDVILSVLLTIGYVVLYFVKFRKKPGFLSATLWGIGGSFIANAIYNAVIILFASVFGEASWKALTESVVITAFITAFAVAGGAVFSAYFVAKFQKRRDKYIEGVTDEMTGLMVGNSFILSPFSQDVSLFYFIQMLLSGFMINSNPSLENLGENVTQADWDQIVALFLNIRFLDILHLAVYMIVMAFSYMVVFKMVNRLFVDKPTWFRVVIPTMVTWSFMFLMYGVLLLEVASLVKLIVYILFGVFIWFVNAYIDKQGTYGESIEAQ